jgi:hypothetical protein
MLAMVTASMAVDTNVEPGSCKIVGVGYHGTTVVAVVDRNLVGPGSVA